MATFALIQHGQVWETWDYDPGLGELFDIREVSKVKGIAAGWVDKGDGAYAAPEPVATEIPVPASVTKLGLKRALSETGDDAVFSKPQWQAVKDFLTTDPDNQEEWDLAIELRADDRLLSAIGSGLKWKDAQVKALLIRAAALVA